MPYIKKIKILFIFALILISLQCGAFAGNLVTMVKVNPVSGGDNVLNLYLYDKTLHSVYTIKENINDIDSFGNLNPDETKYVHGEETENGDSFIVVDTISSSNKNTITPAGGMYSPNAFYNKNGKIIFIGGDGTLKQMNEDGSNVETLAVPANPYTSFGYIVMSPDRKKLLITEDREPCGIYEQCNFQRMILIDLVTMQRTLVTEEYLGDWNIAMWRPDSSSFYYIYHEFLPGDDRNYITITGDIPCDGSRLIVTDLSNSDMAEIEMFNHNVVLYTKSNNFMSVLDQNIYSGKTGEFIYKDTDLPIVIFNANLFGYDEDGVYFTDPDGSNFIEKGNTNIDLDGDIAAYFTSDTVSGSAPLTVNFTDQSCGIITSWTWDFGDGSNPSHTYTNPGTYTVSLIVTGPGGSDEKTEVDFISVSLWTRKGMPFIPLLLLDD